MFNWKFYHGTSTKAYESIKKTGFVLAEDNFHRFFGMNGVYLVCDRPLVANKFAERTALGDNSEPIVLEVPIKMPEISRILNLVSDEGMHLLYQSYEENYRLLSPPKLGINTPNDYKDYFDTINNKNVEIEKTLKPVFKRWRDKPEEVNWDVLAIRTLELNLNICMIIAAVQEGTTFNLIFSGKEPLWNKIKSYHGVRIRDHIEICLTDTDLIINDNVTVIKDLEQGCTYNHRFVKDVTNATIPDA